jgi:prepilin-type N-terminal cleavage/methylation domain-containing protein
MTSRRSDAGFTLVELCVVIVVLGILLVMASALLSRARVAGNESAAIGAMRVISSAQFAYLNGCGHGYYATSLPVLAAKTAVGSQGYLSEDLGTSATPIRNGYRLAMGVGAEGAVSGTDCAGRPTQTSYYAWAVPITPGRTGNRTFATNPKGAVWQKMGPTPPPEPFGPPAEPAH